MRALRRLIPLAAACLVAAASAAPHVLGLDPVRGRELYETHCLGCHYERIHNRDRARSIVRTREGLRIEVARRSRLTGRDFSVEELDDIAEYLNRSHYRFEE